MCARKGIGPGEAKHGKPYWVLEVREAASVEVPQEMLNHWGFEASSQAAVDDAYQKLNANKAEYGITRVQKPAFRNGSYALYCVDKDSNWWEVEYRTPDLDLQRAARKGRPVRRLSRLSRTRERNNVCSRTAYQQ